HDYLESRREFELRQDEIVVVGNHRALGERAFGAGRHKIVPLDYFAQPLNLRAINRRRTHAQLEAVVLGRVVTAGNHRAAVHLPAQHRKIKQRRWHHADVNHEVVVEIVSDDAADVVLAEYLRIHYRQSVRPTTSVQDSYLQDGYQ